MDLELIQARWTLGVYPAEELPDLAAQLMVAGRDGPAVAELASFHRPARYEVLGAFARLMTELGQRPMSYPEAAVVLARHGMREIARALADGATSPADAAARLLELRYPREDAPAEMIRLSDAARRCRDEPGSAGDLVARAREFLGAS